MTADQPENRPAFDPTIQTEDIAFGKDELIACPKCSRHNPPNRVKCLYCAAFLETAPAAGVPPKLRTLEAWEKGWNVIVRSADTHERLIGAPLLSIDPDALSKLVGTAVPLPLARVEDEKTAVLLVEGLKRSGITCSIVSDEQLNVNRPPVRVSGMISTNGRIEVTDFNTHKTTGFDAGDLALIVVGELETSKVDVLEKRRRGKETKVLDETATSADETMVDLYTKDDPIGYRIQMTGFDFSCLGDDKGLLAAENMKLVMAMLNDIAPNAKIVADHARVRHLLDSVWPLESRKEPQGLQRSGFAKKEFGMVSTTSNLLQFTKYSRMQWHLL